MGNELGIEDKFFGTDEEWDAGIKARAAQDNSIGIEPPLDLYGGQVITVDDAADELGISPEAYVAKRLKELETGEVAKVEVLHAVKIDEWPMLMERDLEARLAKTKFKAELTKSDVSGLRKFQKLIIENGTLLTEYYVRADHRLMERPKKGGFKLQTVSSRDVKK